MRAVAHEERPPGAARGPWRSAAAWLPRWGVSDPTPPLWQLPCHDDTATLLRVLAGLRRLPDASPDASPASPPVSLPASFADRPWPP